jgi:hypothetical protein
MDYVTCGTGSYFDFHSLIPTSLYPARLGESAAAALKAVVRHAVVQAESHIRTPAGAEAVLAAGHADMVSIVRGQIADPHLVAKARAGHAERVRPCISCNQLCWGRRSRDYWISCLVNPSVGREAQWGGDRFTPAAEPCRVLVVGGGPAGLEAARVSAERDHHVMLFEASSELGGQWRLVGQQPTRSQVLDHLAWYARELERLGVEIRCGRALEAGDVAGERADRVIVAVGSTPPASGFQRALRLADQLPGIGLGNATTAQHVLGGEVDVKGRVLVLDDVDDWRGIGTAMFLQECGCSVTIATAAPAVAAGLYHSAADVPARRRFALAGGELAPNTVVAGWGGDAASLRSTLTGTETQQRFDWRVVAGTPVARVELSAELDRLGVQHTSVGDCLAPRTAAAAILDGRRAALAT